MRVWMMARRFQRGADRADAAVHHVRRRDDVGAGLGVRQRLLDQRFDGGVVDDVAGLVDEAVLAVRRERIERDVGDHAELRKCLLQRAHRALREAFGIPRLARIEALRVGRRHRKQRERRDAELGASPATRTSSSIDRRSTPGIDGTGSRTPRPSTTNTGMIRSAGAEIGLAHQRARERIAAHAAHASAREFACLSVGHRH